MKPLSAGSRLSASSSVHEAFLDSTSDPSEHPLERKALVSLEMRLQEREQEQQREDRKKSQVETTVSQGRTVSETNPFLFCLCNICQFDN